MNKLPQLMILLVVSLSATSAWAFRCNNHIVQEGDHTYEVIERCGEPAVKESLGYTLNKQLKRELVLERWVYGPNNGYRYALTFEGGVLKTIEGRRAP